MSVQDVPFPFLSIYYSKEVVINFFDRMVNAEVRKNISWHSEMQMVCNRGTFFVLRTFLEKRAKRIRYSLMKMKQVSFL